jgi:hypothetical protein
VAVLEQAPTVVPVFDGIDEEFDDLLGELVAPPKAEPVDDLDDILGEIAGPAKMEPADDLNDVLGEISVPAEAEAVDDFDDILGEIAGPAKTEPADDFDDILSDIAGPAKVEASLDDILGELAPAVASAADESKAKASRKRAAPARDETDDLSAMLDEMTPQAPSPAPAEEASAETKKPGIGAKVAKLGGLLPSLKGTRQISRKSHVGLVGALGLLGLTTIVQTTYILTGSHEALSAGHALAAHGERTPAAAIPLVPVDYSKMDLTRYRDKVRALGEGGRDMLRNPAIKNAILQLDNGEQVYDELITLSRLSKAADLVSIGENRLTINSCNLAACADKSFKLVYDLQHETATVCLTDKYLNGSYLSYSYSPEGYREEPSCNGVAKSAVVAAAAPEHGTEQIPEVTDEAAESADHGAEAADESAHGTEH